MIRSIRETRRTSSLPARAEGTELIEFILIFPVILLLIFGMVEVGHLLYRQHQLNAATQSAVRVMAQRGGVNLKSGEPLKSALRAASENYGFGIDGIKSYSAKPNYCRSNNTEITLTTRASISPVTPLGGLWKSFGGSKNDLAEGKKIWIYSSAVARCEVTWQ